MTKQEIFNAIKEELSRSPSVSNGAIAGYAKLLALWDQADSIAKMVDTRHQDDQGRFTKQECFDAIKDDLPISITQEARDMYQARLAFFKVNDDVKTISAKLADAKAKTEDPNFNAKEFLEQLQKKDRSLSKEAFAFVAAREKVNDDARTFEKSKKTQLSFVINAAKQASKKHSKDVNEVECSVYRCNWCAKNNATAEYTDDYNVFAVDCNGDKLATCLLCGKQNFISMFKRIGRITFAEVEVEAKRKLLDEKKETKKKRKAVDAKVEPSMKTERNGSGGVVSKQHDNCGVTVTSRDYSVGRGDSGGGSASMRSKFTVMAPPGKSWGSFLLIGPIREELSYAE